MLEMYSEARIAVIREVRNHPKLVADLKVLGPNAEWPDQLGEIAAYCLVMMDGVYLPHELEKLYDVLYTKLKMKSMIRIH